MNSDFEAFLKEYEQNLDNPEWISRGIVHLAVSLYRHNTLMSQAELAEIREIGNLLEITRDGKRLSVSEAEKRAIANTNNYYSEMKSTGEAIVETINAMKKRLDLLSWERKSPQY